MGKRRTISNLGRENLPYYLNCFALFGWKTGSGWYRPSLQSRSARGTGLRFALFHSMAKSGRYTPISWLVCFAQIGWRGVKGEFTPHLAARRSLTEWIVSPIWAGRRNLDDTDQIFIRTPARTSYPGLPNQLTPRWQLPRANRLTWLTPHNIALSKEQLTLHLTKHNLPYMMNSRK